MAESPLASNNPFRRKGMVPPSSAAPFAEPEAPAAQTPSPAPTGQQFREQLRALPKSSEAAPSTSFQKIKPVKKVRVQSPPPSSPESADADFEARFPAAGAPDQNYSSASDDDDDDDDGQDP